ncbi:TrmH family RNA methyltransferase, partial [Vagococcus sp.]
SMQGSQFHIQIQEMNVVEKMKELQSEGYTVYGTELNESAIAYQQIEKSDKIAIVMGNEGQGISKEVLNETDCNVYITMRGKAESLNVAVAAGIMMFFV